jgi:acetylornithine deacetylase
VPDELVEEIGRAVDSAVPEAIEFLGALIAARPILGEEAGGQAVFAEAMETLGLDAVQLPVPDSIGQEALAGIPQASYADRPNVLARTAEGELAILINGHIDVVPADGEGWSTPPWSATERDGWVFGRGAGDMKGGFAMTWLALSALRRAHPQALEVPIGVLSVIEEECTGNGTLAALRAGVAADIVLLPEPTDLQLLLGGVGIVWGEIILRGAAGHAEEADRVDSVVDILARLIPALTQLGRTAATTVDPAFASIAEPYNVNIGTIQAGDWPSSVAGSARLGVRFAHPRAWSVTEALAKIEAVVSDCCAGSSVVGHVTPTGFRAEGYALDPAAALVDQMRSAHAEVHGHPCGTFVLGSTTDARYYVNTAGVPALCYGPVARRIHGADEAVEVASIADGAKTLALFLARQASAPPATMSAGNLREE